MKLDYTKALAHHHGNRQQLQATVTESLARYEAIENPSPGIRERIEDYRQVLEKCREENTVLPTP